MGIELKKLNEINTYISYKVSLGSNEEIIYLNQYNNMQINPSIIEIPAEIERIKFISDDYTLAYNLSIFIQERNKDLEIQFENLYINSKNIIGIDFRAAINPQYINTFRYFGINTVDSEESIGICVSNGQTVNFIADENDTLNVNGGIGYCAIGNSNEHIGGGKIIFSGDGTVNAIGGNGAKSDVYASKIGLDGAHGIGFVTTTLEKTYIVIKGNAKLHSTGGNGQNCSKDNNNTGISSGNGGSGISLGVDGIFINENCSGCNNIVIKGGDAGNIVDTFHFIDLITGGNGGNAICLDSGLVNVLGSIVLTAGNGAGIALGKDYIPVQGGNGGCGIKFTGEAKIGQIDANQVTLNNDINICTGSGGNSGVTVNVSDNKIAVQGLNGGNSGNIIDINNENGNIILGSIIATTGSGGNGGSTNIYYYGEPPIEGVDKPGTGGNTGSLISGDIATITYLKNPILINGEPGKGGIGVKYGSEFNGVDGIIGLKADVTIKSTPHFGYFNINTFMNLFQEKIDTSEDNHPIIPDGKLFFSQHFDNCLNLDELYVQEIYDKSLNGKIFADGLLYLVVSTSIAEYKNK